jgi:DNA-binding response OmpR family regulator
VNRPAILIVEEDSIHRATVALALSQAGFEVVLADTGAEALTLLDDGIPFAGLYTDLRLPGHINGWAVGSEFYARWPDKPIVYASAREHSPEMVFRHPGVILRKPIRPSDLKIAFQM